MAFDSCPFKDLIYLFTKFVFKINQNIPEMYDISILAP